jgi:ABC-type phosphate transport system substrate-binding protein
MMMVDMMMVNMMMDNMMMVDMMMVNMMMVLAIVNCVQSGGALAFKFDSLENDSKPKINNAGSTNPNNLTMRSK